MFCIWYIKLLYLLVSIISIPRGLFLFTITLQSCNLLFSLYFIPIGHHWVMWYGSMFQPCSDEEITADILQELTKTLSTGMPLNSTATTTATAAIAVQNIQNAASMLSLLRTGVTSGQLPTIATNTAIVATATPTPTATSAGLGLGTGSIGGSEGNIDFDFAWYVCSLDILYNFSSAF